MLLARTFATMLEDGLSAICLWIRRVLITHGSHHRTGGGDFRVFADVLDRAPWSFPLSYNSYLLTGIGILTEGHGVILKTEKSIG